MFNYLLSYSFFSTDLTGSPLYKPHDDRSRSNKVRDFPHFNIRVSIPTNAEPNKETTAHVYTNNMRNPGEVVALTVGAPTRKTRET